MPYEFLLIFAPIALAALIRPAVQHPDQPTVSLAQTQEEDDSRWASHTAALLEVQRHLLAQPDIRTAYSAILALLGKATDASRMYLCETDPAQSDLLPVTVQASWPATDTSPIPEEFPLAALFSRRITALAHGDLLIIRVAELPEAERAAWQARGVTALCIAPLYDGGACAGCLVLEYDGDHAAPSLPVQRLLQTAALSISLAIAGHKRSDRMLQQMVLDLQRSNRDLEQFAYVASHDLQEPLRMVSSYVELLARRYQGQLDERADTYIMFAKDGADRMQELIQALLTYSRIGTQAKPPAPVALETVLASALTQLQSSIETTGAIITHDPLPTVHADEAQMLLLLQNLLSNALKFHRDIPPQIHFTAERDSAFWTLGVHDNGIGVDPKYAERIFVIFQRLHTRRDYPGTGIGLALCKKIVERHGGKIWLESQPERGASFYFTLPNGGGD